MKRKLRAFATSVVALLWGCSLAATEARAADPVLTRLLGDVLWAPRLAYGSDDQVDLENKLLSNFKQLGDMVLELLLKSQRRQQGSSTMKV